MAVRYRLGLIIPFIIAAGAIICIISLATPWWCLMTDLPEPVMGVYFGLWQACTYFTSDWETGTVCEEVTTILFDSTWLNAARAMVIISVLLSFATFPLAIISNTTIKNNAIFSIAAALLTLAQATTMMTGLAIFIGKVYSELNDFGVISVGWSFGIGWAGVSSYILGAICLVIEAFMLTRHQHYENINKI